MPDGMEIVSIKCQLALKPPINEHGANMRAFQFRQSNWNALCFFSIIYMFVKNDVKSYA
jgi:hypothetical protein